ncbi:MAG: cell division protein FtsA [Verrucomicrobiota bacterium]
MYKTKVIAGVEIGTGKVTVLLGEIVEGRSLNVIGLGQSSSGGVVKGRIVDFHEASDCVHAAILAAENQAGVKIDGVYLAMSGAHIDGFLSEASVNITGPERRVTREEMDQVVSMAQNREMEDSRTVIHHLRRPFRLDGRSVSSPVTMQGEKLESSYWTIHGDAATVSDAIHVVNGFNLHVDDIILSSLATASAVATDEEKKNGCMVVDIGRGTTDYALFQDSHCLFAGSLPLGGDHISNDLSIGLRMRLKQAESLKIRYGSAIIEHRDKSEKVWQNNDFEIGDRQIPVWSIERIIELRTQEIFEVVRKKLGALYNPDRLAGGIIISGGSSRLRNIDKCAEGVLGIRARIGDNSLIATGELKDAQYSTALGLLQYGLQYQSEKELAESRSGGLFGKLKELFQKD